MSLFVNTNVVAINANRQLFNANSSLDTSFERLSSGFRINNASDDAAGLQISNRLTTQVNGLNQAVRNANDGISLVQTADGALEEVTTALQRMRVLAIQAENGINSDADKDALQKEVAQLKTEIDRIADTTQFGGTNLFDGIFSASFLVGSNAGQKIDVVLNEEDGYNTQGIGVAAIDIQTPLSPTTDELEITGGAPFTSGTTLSMPGLDNVVTGLMVSADGVNFTQLPDITLTSAVLGNTTPFLSALQSSPVASIITGANALSSTDIQIFLSQPIYFAVSPDGNVANINTQTGLSIAQLGPGNTDDRPIKSNLSILDGAISRIGGIRAELGALQNRFQSTIRNLSNIEENVSAARSQIRDTDYAIETASLSRNQIVREASISVLAQANTQPQIALSLLG